MNERFEKLSLQATEYANQQNELHGVGYVITFKEKFAELIVRECIDITNAEMDDILDQPVFNPTDEFWNRARVEELVRVVKLIKKRFGVEE